MTTEIPWDELTMAPGTHNITNTRWQCPEPNCHYRSVSPAAVQLHHEDRHQNARKRP